MKATKEQLIENWTRCLYILDFFISICEKYGLNYQMAYGSALGAVRHQGFIPWDKNLDVSMPLPDFQKFMEVCPNELPDDLVFVSFDHGNDLGRQIPRIIFKENELINGEKWFNPNLDISVWCGAPNSKVLQNIIIHLALFNNKVFRLRNIRKKRQFPFNIIRGILRLIPNSFLRNQFSTLMNKYDFKNAQYIMSLESVYGNEIFSKRIAEELVLLPFEGRKVYVSKDYDTYLKTLYGNYMEPIVFKKHQ